MIKVLDRPRRLRASTLAFSHSGSSIAFTLGSSFRIFAAFARVAASNVAGHSKDTFAAGAGCVNPSKTANAIPVVTRYFIADLLHRALQAYLAWALSLLDEYRLHRDRRSSGRVQQDRGDVKFVIAATLPINETFFRIRMISRSISPHERRGRAVSAFARRRNLTGRFYTVRASTALRCSPARYAQRVALSCFFR